MVTPIIEPSGAQEGANTTYTSLALETQTFATIIPSLVNLSTPTNTLTGTSAGSVIWNMPYQGTGYKKAIFYLNGYENTTATAQTITFPTAFTYTPYVITSISGVSATTTALTLPASMTATATGYVIVEGF